METNAPQQQEGFKDDPFEAEKNQDDPLVGATTFEDLMKVVCPNGRWTTMVVLVCVSGMHTSRHPLLRYLCLSRASFA